MADYYEELDHTGDLAISVSGRDLAEVFRHAALALFALLVEGDGTEEQTRGVRVRGQDREDLLHEWLSRLLSDFYAEGFVVTDVPMITIGDRELEATVAGHRFRSGRDRLLREIKAVTYHGLTLRAGKNGWEARITFDV
ncbi:MAG: protein archease [Candidatus Binatia bacterium]|nr:MAG: protein archease [Candidatus Binatia bacterium]